MKATAKQAAYMLAGAAGIALDWQVEDKVIDQPLLTVDMTILECLFKLADDSDAILDWHGGIHNDVYVVKKAFDFRTPIVVNDE